MAAKTAWGRAQSKEFKRLHKIWKRTGKVGTKKCATWKTAFKEISKKARAYADKKATNPIAKKKRKSTRKKSSRKKATKRKSTRKSSTRKKTAKRKPAKKRKATKRKSTRKKPRTAAQKRATRKMIAANKKKRRPSAKKKTTRKKPAKKRAKKKTVKRSVSRKTARKRASTKKGGEKLGRLVLVKTTLGDVKITSGGKLKRVGRSYIVEKGNGVIPPKVARRGKVSIREIHRKIGKDKLVVEKLKKRKLDLTVPGVLIIK